MGHILIVIHMTELLSRMNYASRGIIVRMTFSVVDGRPLFFSKKKKPDFSR